MNASLKDLTLLILTPLIPLNAEKDAKQGDFLWHLAESAANQVQVGLVGLASTGLDFA